MQNYHEQYPIMFTDTTEQAWPTDRMVWIEHQSGKEKELMVFTSCSRVIIMSILYICIRNNINEL